MQECYREKLQIVLRDSKDLNTWKDRPQLGMERFNTAETQSLPRFIYKLNTIPVNIPIGFFIEHGNR